MNLSKSKLILLATALFLATLNPVLVQAATHPLDFNVPHENHEVDKNYSYLYLAQVEQEGTAAELPQEEILETLESNTPQAGDEKKCMMVCQEWGKDCVINPRTGSKKCRRVCKKLGQECF